MKKCLYSELCGGCFLQGISYQKQLNQKEEYISSLLENFSPIDPIIGMEEPLNYRNKVQFSFDYNEKHQAVFGYFIPGTHKILPIDECMIADEKAVKIVNSINRLINKYKISIFNERTYKGCIRHILIRTTNTGEIMVVIVSGSYNIPKKDELINDIVKYNPEITTIIQNINNKHTSAVLTEKNIVLYGKGYIYDVLCEKRFKISPNSFYQVNKRQTEVLYNKVIELANFKGNEVLVDAYCGIGTIGLIASKYVKKVIGIELNKNAIKDANKNKIINDVKNITFIADDAGKYMESLAKQRCAIDVLVMDPPRSGADERFLKAVFHLKPEKIIYVSCGPESLKSNLYSLCKNGYKVFQIQPVDMFPFTSHIETVVLLSREKVDGHIEIDLDVEKLEGKSGTATYAEIKKYVADHNDGMKVTSPYIGQIKNKMGLEKRKNYNVGSGEGRVPSCPRDKEEAIVEAFKHFNLIDM